MHWLLEPTRPPRPMADFDAGLLYGYSVYTTFRWPLPERWLQAHLKRLTENAECLGMRLALAADSLAGQLAPLVTPDEPVVRLTAFPEVAGYGDFFAQAEFSARLIASTRALPKPPGRKLIVHSAPYERPFPAIKLGGIAESVLLKRQARAHGADDVLFVNRAGCFSEASTANVFFIQGNSLLTPEPEQDQCLPGITRLQVIEAAFSLGVRVAVGYPVLPESLPSLDGAFLCNAVSGIQPVERVDDHEFPWTASALEMAVHLSSALR